MPSLTHDSDRHVTIDHRTGQYNCFPDVCRAPDGRLICAYNEFDAHVATRRKLLIKTSDDNGRTWSEARVLDPARSHCPRLTCLSDGSLLLSDDVGKTLRRSVDGGENWEIWTGKGIREHGLLDHVVELDMPAAGGLRAGGKEVGSTPPAEPEWFMTGHYPRGTATQPTIGQPPVEQMGYASTNTGRNWRLVSPLNPVRDLTLCEASVCLMPDGTLLALMRENSFVGEPMYAVTSQDRGRTWSLPMPTPLVGHRPTLGMTASGKLLCTYRNVGPDGGTCAWVGSQRQLLTDFQVHGPAPGHAEIDNEGLCMEGCEDTPVRYLLRPITSPERAFAELSADIRVDGGRTWGLRLGCRWIIQGRRIFPVDAEDNRLLDPVELDSREFIRVGIIYERGGVVLFVDGRERRRLNLEPADRRRRPILVGDLGTSPNDNADAMCHIRSLSLRTREPSLDRPYDWTWTPEEGLPDAWVRKNVLELKNDRNAAYADFGYSGWCETSPGSFFCAYHHGGGMDPDYVPGESSRIMGTSFGLRDFD